MKKILGIILVLILTVILANQIKSAQAQLADEPITGPITSPITGPLLSPTPTPSVSPTMTPTPTLIQTISTTPTPTITPTPTPVNISNYTKLGGLNLDGYCSAIGSPWDVVLNGTWYCGNGSEIITMTDACRWQYGMSNVVAVQDVANDVYSWSCYTPASSVSPTETPSVTPTLTPTETPSVTPSVTLTSTPSLFPTNTPNPTQSYISAASHRRKNNFHPTFFHFSKGFPFSFVNASNFFNTSHFFTKPAEPQTIIAKACTTHDAK